jgi:hypothetical protein
MGYTYAQLEQLWIDAGGSAAAAPIMAAIAMAESGGNPNATDYDSNGTVDRGLWQINSIWGSLSTFDPTANAQSAVQVYNQQGITAWATYNSGAYKQFLSGGSVTTPNTPGATTTDASTSGTPSTSLNPADALNDMWSLFHGVAGGLNWLFWLWQPGQGWRFIIGIGGVASGVGAAKLYTSPGVTEEKSATFPGAILLTGVALMCLYMTMRAWPVDSNGDAVRPAAYAVMILKGEKPPAGPPAPDNTGQIQLGLEAIASIWVVNKVASSVSGLAGAAGIFAGLWAGLKKVFGSGDGEAPPEIPEVDLTVPNYPGLTGAA